MFNRCDQLSAHVRSHDKSRPYTCSRCASSFPTLSAFYTHITSLHVDFFPVDVCPICEELYEDLDNHFYLHDPISARANDRWRSTYECPYKLCQKKNFVNQKVLDIHIHTMHGQGGQAYVCEQCDAVFPSFFELDEHSKEEHCKIERNDSNTMYCSHCAKAFPNNHALAEHVRESHGIFMSLKSEVLSSPTTESEESKTVEYPCSSCNQIFSSADLLNDHQLEKHTEIIYRCGFCKETLDSKVGLRVHFSMNHSNEQRSYKCTDCSAAFSTEILWQMHMRRHNSKPYRCLLCDETYATERELETHSVTHKKTVKCPVCEEAFHVEYLLDLHLQTAHFPVAPPPAKRSKKERTKCEICDVRFPDELALVRHRRIEHKLASSVSPSTLKCVYCQTECFNSSELEFHIQEKHAPPPIVAHKCNICDKLLPSSTSLVQHKLGHVTLPSRLICFVCQATIVGKDDFLNHSRDHSVIGSKCLVCRQAVNSSEELRLHSEHHFPEVKCSRCHITPANNEPSSPKEGSSQSRTNDKTRVCSNCQKQTESKNNQLPKAYQCIKCQQSFLSENEIQAHVATHILNESNVHECRLCWKNFDTPARLQCHLIEHSFDQGKPFECYVCNKVLTSSATIQQHVLEHSVGSRKYSCASCSNVYFFSAELENHKLTHHSHVATSPTPSPCRCPVCGIVYENSAILHQHVLDSHSSFNKKNEQLECGECRRTFACQAALISHSKSHKFGKENKMASQTNKPFSCSICSRNFTKKSQVREHMKVHYSQTVFTCPQCSAIFREADELRLHSNSVHYMDESCSLCQRSFADSQEYR